MKKIVFLFVLVVIVATTNSCTQSSEKEALSIISKAIELCKFIPDLSSRKLIEEGLSQMVIYRVKDNGKVEFPYGKQFILLVAKGKQLGNTPENDKKTLFRFEGKQLEKTHHAVIVMNEDISSFSKDIDAMACALIHEFVHVLQANNRLQKGLKLESVAAYTDEQQAWECMVYLYGRVHPDIYNISCNCEESSINISAKQKISDYSDPLVQSFIFYNFCRDKFLLNSYKDDRIDYKQ